MQADRVALRALEANSDDLALLVEASRSRTLDRTLNELVWPIDTREADRRLNRLDFSPRSRSLLFAVERTDVDDRRVIGWGGLPDIDWIHQHAQLEVVIPNDTERGLGLGTETILLLLQLAFDELALRRVYASTVEYNTRALKALKRVGFSTEACRREAHFHGGRYHDVVMLGLVEPEYRSLHGYERLRAIGYTDQQIGRLGSAAAAKQTD